MGAIIGLQLYTVRDETASDLKSTFVDPISFKRKHPRRIVALHLKDMTPDRTFTEVGDGTLAIASDTKAAQSGGTKYFILENDNPSIPSLESARRSFENMRRSMEWW
jgi:sugar phosphate isomerase/epimerase